ncbi:helix-turn-helix domain-containing protein [Comamonas testosteroni]|uniref:helix-turn-helix domain-containing protein n=1 Tax=Comamonas testosteroni TaxID=285 RepID=UPI00389A0E42
MVFEVTPLVRELIFECTKFRWDYLSGSAEHRMSQVLVDQFHKLDHTPVNLPMPTDTRALKIVEILSRNPGNRETLAQLSESVGASARTIERIFARETPMTFGVWRQRQRLVAAIERLAYGASIHSIAHDVGYDSPSSFVVAFKNIFGSTPAQYFKATSSGWKNSSATS